MSGHGLPNIPRRLGPISLSATSLVHNDARRDGQRRRTKPGTGTPVHRRHTPGYPSADTSEDDTEYRADDTRGARRPRRRATGIAAINTIKCITRIDEKALTARPVVCGLSSVSGYSGKAVRPIALRFIHELASDPSAGKMPISGIGGIETWRDALDFLLLGCTNLQICTAVMQYGFRIMTIYAKGYDCSCKRTDIKPYPTS